MVKETEKDPNEGLAHDATLATDLGDEKKRTAEQLEYYGGTPDSDDSADLSELDRGDNLDDKKEGDTDRGDEVDDDKSEEESDDEKEDKGDSEEKGGDAEESDKEESDGADDDSPDDGDQTDTDEEDDVDEVDEEDDVDEVDEEDEKPKDTGIPRHRFNEVNQRMKDAEEEIRRRDAEKGAKDDAAEDKYDFDKAEEEYMGLLLDGKTKEAGVKRREIRIAEKEDFKSEALADTTSHVNQTNLEKSVNMLTAEAERMFPVFNRKSDTFNPEAVSKTLTIMKGYQVEGMPADDAFVAALADVIDLYDLATESEDTESEDEEDKDAEKGEAKKKVTKGKPISKVKDKLATQKKQAKSPVGEGKGSADVGAVVPDIDKLTDEELDALPADTLARLRGDFV